MSEMTGARWKRGVELTQRASPGRIENRESAPEVHGCEAEAKCGEKISDRISDDIGGPGF